MSESTTNNDDDSFLQNCAQAHKVALPHGLFLLAL